LRCFSIIFGQKTIYESKLFCQWTCSYNNAMVLTSCGVSTTLQSWKSPEIKTGISKVVIMPMFNKIEYAKPFEQAMSSYFNGKGLKSIGSLEFLNPDIKYTIADIKRKCDSLGADAILVSITRELIKHRNTFPKPLLLQAGLVVTGVGVTMADTAWVQLDITVSAPLLQAVMGNNFHCQPEKQGCSLMLPKCYLVREITVTDPKYVDEASNAIARKISQTGKAETLSNNEVTIFPFCILHLPLFW